MHGLMFNKSNTTGSTYGTGTAYLSRAPEFIPSLWWYTCCSIFCFLCNI